MQPEDPSDNLLSLADVLRELGWTENKYRSAMNRYLAFPDVDELLGATGNGRMKRYREDRLWLFRELTKAHNAGTIQPKTAAEFLRKCLQSGPAIDALFEATEYPNNRISEYSDNPDNSANPPGGALALSPLVAGQIQEIGHQFGDTFANIVIERIRASGIIPPPEDRLIGREEAAQLLGIPDKPQLVARRVPSVLPGLWSRLQILAYIGELREAATKKAAAKRQKKTSG